MSNDKHDIKKYSKISQLIDNNEESSGGQGGQSGAIEFRFKDDRLAPSREDLLSPQEIKRLQVVHKDLHKDRVDKQKQERSQRAAVKEGRYVPPQSGLGQASGRSGYKKHPISNKAQFSGIDKQVIGIANLNTANTNDQLKDALENKLENKNRLTHAKRFDPRPRYPGG